MAYQNVVKNYSAFSAAALTSDLTIWTAPYPCVLSGVVLNNVVDFAGGAVSACTISVGKDGAETGLLAATNVFTGASNGYANAVTGTGATALNVFFNTGDALQAKMTCTTANCDALTAGQVQILFNVEAVPKAQA